MTIYGLFSYLWLLRGYAGCCLLSDACIKSRPYNQKTNTEKYYG